MSRKEFNLHLSAVSGIQHNKHRYRATLVPRGPTKRPDDLINDIIAGGTEFRPETIRNILDLAAARIADYLAEGYSYQDRNFHHSPIVHGIWHSLTPGAAEKQSHRITVSTKLTPSMRAHLRDVNLNILGEKHATAAIGRIVSLAGDTPGDALIAGEYIRITGRKIKIFPDSDDLGVFFVPMNGAPAVRVAHRLHENRKGMIEAQVPPQLPPGDYIIQVRTRFTDNPSKPLQEPRIIEYDYPLTVRPAIP
ncbi:MAG: DUF4469 domain-containing protein [Tannerellaceae bacterium]|jgi:hypothetical protein|nr:DUF4469 domain-containing protein [Tannerellaceae bacterium]